MPPLPHTGQQRRGWGSRCRDGNPQAHALVTVRAYCRTPSHLPFVSGDSLLLPGRPQQRVILCRLGSPRARSALPSRGGGDTPGLPVLSVSVSLCHRFSVPLAVTLHVSFSCSLSVQSVQMRLFRCPVNSHVLCPSVHLLSPTCCFVNALMIHSGAGMLQIGRAHV